MKKKLAMILAAALACSMILTGCGGNGGAGSTGGNTGGNNAGGGNAGGGNTGGGGSSYPTSDIQMIVPVNPGGDTDANARLLAQYIEPELGVAVPIVNVAGSSGTVGMEQVRSSDPDGYTCLFFHAEAMIPKIAGLIDYQLDEFKVAGVCLKADTTLLVTHNDSGFSTLQEFLDQAKANPGKIEFGMAVGGYPQLVGLALEREADIDLNLVDIGGNADKIAALAGHNTDIINVEYALVKDYIEAGEFIPLALLSEERNPLFSDIPTAVEQGLPGMVFGKFFFVAFPKDTPDDIVNTFSAAMKTATEDEGFIKAAQDSYALTVAYMDPAEGTAYANEIYEKLNSYQDLFLAANQ